MKNKAFLLLGTAITISTFVAFSFRNAPNNFLQQLQEKFKQHQVKVAPEKLYLQFDRTQYKPGEDIWFQAYLRDANSLKASTQSSIIYVELWNPKGVLEKKLSLLAKDGLAHGDFALNEDAAGGIYKIKAYTNWQRNTNTIFEREISVEKTILPRLNRKLKFEREAFGVGDEVIARLDLQTLASETLSNYEFDFVVQLEGKTILTKTATTNEKGRAYISFNLPNDLKTNDGLLNVIIPYQGQFESIARAIPIVLGEIDLQFFPEGGNQVSGIESKVAFKALNEFGKPADVAGVIEDEDGNIITAFESFHQGMGAFSLKAEKGEAYFARLHQPTGNQQR
ncbi:MAG: MG2 domain-containing protein, partial [Bacteroidota bacterium]